MGIFGTPEPMQIQPPPPPVAPDVDMEALAAQRRKRDAQRVGRGSLVIEPALRLGAATTSTGTSAGGTGISIPPPR